MSELPAELKTTICSFLEIADLKSVRQINASWTGPAIHLLFAEIWFTQATLQNLLDIRRSRNLRPFVKTMVIYTEQIPDLMEQMWREAFIEKNPELNPEIVDMKYNRYAAAYAQQQRFYNQKEHVTRIRGSLSGLYNLHTISIAGPDWYKNVDPTSSVTSVWRWSPVFKDIHSMGLLSNMVSRRQGIYKPLIDVLRSLSQSWTSKVRHVALGVLPLRQDTLTTCLGARIKNITSMDLEVSYFDISETPAERHERVVNFDGFLGEAEHLQKLVLRRTTGYGRLGEDRTTDFFEVFAPNLPALTELRLHGFCTTERSLLGYLTQYQSTISHLGLEHMALGDSDTGISSGSWSSVLRKLPLELGHLIKVHLDNLAYGYYLNDRRLASAYLHVVRKAITQGAPFPKEEAYLLGSGSSVDEAALVSRYLVQVESGYVECSVEP